MLQLYNQPVIVNKDGLCYMALVSSNKIRLDRNETSPKNCVSLLQRVNSLKTIRSQDVTKRKFQGWPGGSASGHRVGRRILWYNRSMMCDWVWLLTLCSLLVIAQSLPTNLADDAKKTEQTMRPKPKRAQEMLMFGNQQNRQPEKKPSTSYTSTAEKRTLAASGLGGLKAALAEEEKPSHSNIPNNAVYDRDSFSPYDRNYDYGKVMMNDLGYEMPQIWDVPSYSRYYMNEDRRKRSEKSTVTGSTTVKPSTTSFPSPTSTQQSVQAQVKRSNEGKDQILDTPATVPIYQEPRFKRELDIDPQDVLTLLSLWENERHKRNWHKYINDEYENADDEDNLLEEEDSRNIIPWIDSSVYPPRHYNIDALSPSDIGIVRTHPSGYYEQYENQYGQQYDTTSQYSGPQYGLVYPQQTYYNTPEKRFMVSKKRSQTYDPYSSAAQFQISSQSRGYPYQHRVVY
ncbi:Prohormone-2 [Melipona quadrifasciata]|uniref:Prohormone-2 n=1 Tax=Melipona quadrifasciata TaxID=166423 RepID=A0A0M9ABG2_9HYME|nr:Prohormone-2 [Melipona quadrifasciata]